MRVLLDTCVVSEIARASGSPRVKKRVAQYPRTNTYLSVATIGEMVRGVTLLEPSKKREALNLQLLHLEEDYGERIIPIDVEIARIWGEISVARQKAGRHLPILDGMIAATAVRHGLHVVTRNVSDFEETGVLIVNPWDDA